MEKRGNNLIVDKKKQMRGTQRNRKSLISIQFIPTSALGKSQIPLTPRNQRLRNLDS